MSVFDVVLQWSVNPLDQEACEQAVKAIAEHVELVHSPHQELPGPAPSTGPGSAPSGTTRHRSRDGSGTGVRGPFASRQIADWRLRWPVGGRL